MIPAHFDYVVPRSLKGATDALAKYGDEAKLLAGGHSLLPMMKLRLAQPGVVIDLKRLAKLRRIRQEDGHVHIGSLVTHHQLETSRVIKSKCGLLAKTAVTIGDMQVRNRGTVGGSIAHADPAADLPAAILALGADVLLTGPSSERWVSLEEFFLGPLTTALEPTEILTTIRLPVPVSGTGSSYHKVKQPASGFAIVGVAVRLVLQGDVCSDLGIGVTGLSGAPFRARTVETELRGQKLGMDLIEKAAARVTEGVQALDDIHASSEFRLHLARLHTGRAIQDALASIR
jgi:carbon-monoxide dehydrogenase medium subunit